MAVKAAVEPKKVVMAAILTVKCQSAGTVETVLEILHAETPCLLEAKNHAEPQPISCRREDYTSQDRPGQPAQSLPCTLLTSRRGLWPYVWESQLLCKRALIRSGGLVAQKRARKECSWGGSFTGIEFTRPPLHHCDAAPGLITMQDDAICADAQDLGHRQFPTMRKALSFKSPPCRIATKARPRQ